MNGWCPSYMTKKHTVFNMTTVKIHPNQSAYFSMSNWKEKVEEQRTSIPLVIVSKAMPEL